MNVSEPVTALLGNLNPQQRKAALHDDSPLLIVAGAGTGKTTTLAHRLAVLIARGVPPRRILLLTFTRRSASELQRRVGSLLAGLPGLTPASISQLLRELWSGTFHAVGTRLLRQYGHLIGLAPGFSILDRGDAEDLLGMLRTELNLAESGSRFPLKGTCLDIYSRCVNTQQSLSHVLAEQYPAQQEALDGLKRLFQAYSERKEVQQLLDYDDLLLFWQILVGDPATAPLIQSQFDNVLVDEYQDTNALQLEILRGLTPAGHGLTVVGDDAQAIYAFRGATVRNILDFPQHFPGATLLPLEQNYRSTQPLLDVTNRVIALATEGHRKTLWSERKEGSRPVLVQCLDEGEQADFVLEQLFARREAGTPFQRQAVLFRAAHHSLMLELELVRRGIRFRKFGGLRFTEAAHIKDMLAFLRFAENPRDSLSAQRMLQLIPGIGPKKAQQFTEQLWETSDWLSAWGSISPPRAATLHWPLFLALLRLLTAPPEKAGSLGTQLRHIRQFLAPLFEKKYDDHAARSRDLEQLEAIAGRFDTRSRMLSDLTLDPPTSLQGGAVADDDEDDDLLTLSTIHSAKGLEWDVVYLLQATEGSLPSEFALRDPASLEEERRLFYVALTRARDALYLLCPQRVYLSSRSRTDNHGLIARTRFLPDELVLELDVIPARTEPGLQDQADVPPVMSTTEVRGRIGRLWD